MTWVFKDKKINSHEDLHPDCTDIVYEITYKSGKTYIGKKAVRAMRRVKPTKAQLAVRKNYVRKELKDLPFINYEGSSDNTANEIIVSKEIVHQCSQRRTATYIEAAWLFEVNAIFNDMYLNENIQGCYFDNAMQGYLEGHYDD